MAMGEVRQVRFTLIAALSFHNKQGSVLKRLSLANGLSEPADDLHAEPSARETGF
jgi:hypothetical protein